MVRRAKSHKRRGVKGGRGYKKCIGAGIRRTKFKTPKMARKAFGKAAKICRKKMTEKKVAHRKGGRKRKATKSRKCKYGHLKNSKRCRKTPRRARR